MKNITLHSYGKSEVEAWTDCYAERYGRVILLSLIGNDSVVKAISGTLLDKKGNSSASLYVNDDTRGWYGRKSLYRDSRSAFKVSTAKLRPGVTHQLICDVRFFQVNEKDEGSGDEDVRYVLARAGEDEAELVYRAVLKHLPTPTLPEWSRAIYEEILARSDDFLSRDSGRISEIDSYPEEVKVISVKVSEEALDGVVSDLVKRGIIGWK
jgi:hypothetical protein